MPKIHITTFIAAPRERVFDLSRNIGLHKISTKETGEEAIGGVTSGPISLNESVTWKARHLGKKRIMQVKITQMESPVSFTDEQVKGDFIYFRHEHHFKPVENGTLMIDMLDFKSPYGIIGQVFNSIYLTGYLEKFLLKRNAVIKRYAETDMWKALMT
jgi:ligand-binding SRPBCC domain-containing protein